MKKWYLVDARICELWTDDIESKLHKHITKNEAINYASLEWHYFTESEKKNIECFYVAYMEPECPNLETAKATYFNKGFFFQKGR